jgi:hypothetical protein
MRSISMPWATPSTSAPSWATCSLSMTWAGLLATEPWPSTWAMTAAGEDEHLGELMRSKRSTWAPARATEASKLTAAIRATGDGAEHLGEHLGEDDHGHRRG